MKTVSIDTAELVEKRFVVTEDDLTYMGTATFAKGEEPDEKTMAAQIDARYAEWKQVMQAPAKEPTKEELEAMKLRAERDKAAAEKQITALSAKLAVVAVEPVKDEPVKEVSK